MGQLKANSTTAGTRSSLERISRFIGMKKTSNFENCIVLAKEQFNSYYDHTIRDLLSIFPADHKDKDGQAFWSGPKRAPSPITFSCEDPAHMNFVMSYANLIAATLNIPPVRDEKAILEMTKNAKVASYVPKKITVKTPEEEKAGANAQPEPEVVAPEDE